MSTPVMNDENVTDPELWPVSGLGCRRSLVDPAVLQLTWGRGTDRRQFETTTARLASYLLGLDSPVRASRLAAELADRLAVPVAEGRSLVDRLINAGLLTGEPGSSAPGRRMWSRLAWQDAAELHDATRATTQYRTTGAAPPPAVRDRMSERAVPLPVPSAGLTDVGLIDTLRRRRTHRRFTDATISTQQLSDVLHWTFRPIINGSSGPRRTTPSSADRLIDGGLSQPFTVFPLLDPHQGPAGLLRVDWRFRYNNRQHALEPIGDGKPAISAISELLWEQDFGVGAPAFLIFAVNWGEYMRQHGSSDGFRMAQLDLGAFMQTALMVATGLGLRTFITPALDDARVAHVLGTEDSEQAPSYLLALGAPTR